MPISPNTNVEKHTLQKCLIQGRTLRLCRADRWIQLQQVNQNPNTFYEKSLKIVGGRDKSKSEWKDAGELVSLWRWHLSEVLKLGQGVHGYVGQEQWEHHASHACGSFVSRNKAVPREKVRKQDEHSLPRIQKSGQAGPLERVTESSRSGLGSIWFSFLWKLIPFSLTKKKIKWILLYYTNNYQLTKTHTVLISEIYALC